MTIARAANVVNISGGKDSAATALLALERGADNLTLVFADTGHEHPITYEYVQYLDREFQRRAGVAITQVKADFTRKMAYRREHIQERWEKGGVPQERIDRAKELLQPTGIPMLDLCMLRGRFPSTQARGGTRRPLPSTPGKIPCLRRWRGRSGAATSRRRR